MSKKSNLFLLTIILNFAVLNYNVAYCSPFKTIAGKSSITLNQDILTLGSRTYFQEGKILDQSNLKVSKFYCELWSPGSRLSIVLKKGSFSYIEVDEIHGHSIKRWGPRQLFEVEAGLPISFDSFEANFYCVRPSQFDLSDIDTKEITQATGNIFDFSFEYENIDQPTQKPLLDELTPKFQITVNKLIVSNNSYSETYSFYLGKKTQGLPYPSVYKSCELRLYGGESLKPGDVVTLDYEIKDAYTKALRISGGLSSILSLGKSKEEGSLFYVECKGSEKFKGITAKEFNEAFGEYLSITHL